MEFVLVFFAFVLAAVMVAAQFQLFAIRRLLEELVRRRTSQAISGGEAVVASQPGDLLWTAESTIDGSKQEFRRSSNVAPEPVRPFGPGGDVNWKVFIAFAAVVFAVVIVLVVVTWK